MKNLGRGLVLLGVAALVLCFFYFDLKSYLSLEYIKTQQDEFKNFYQNNPLLTIGGFFVTYVAVTGLSLPGAALLTLLAGALFGLLTGVLIVSFASSLGATLAFLTSRFLLRNWVQEKFSSQLKKINKGIEDEGAFFLFTLRLIPALPFFVINLAMGLTPMKTITFYWVSQLGMLAGTFVYVNAGTQLAQIESLSGILSPKLIVSFCILGLFPIITKKIMAFVGKNKMGEKNGEI